MKKYPKLVQADKRGQIVIPKDVRQELGIEEGTGFYMYTIENEGIILKSIDAKPLSSHKQILDELEIKSDKIGISKENISKSVENYMKKGRLEEI